MLFLLFIIIHNRKAWQFFFFLSLLYPSFSSLIPLFFLPSFSFCLLHFPFLSFPFFSVIFFYLRSFLSLFLCVIQAELFKVIKFLFKEFHMLWFLPQHSLSPCSLHSLSHNLQYSPFKKNFCLTHNCHAHLSTVLLVGFL